MANGGDTGDRVARVFEDLEDAIPTPEPKESKPRREIPTPPPRDTDYDDYARWLRGIRMSVEGDMTQPPRVVGYSVIDDVREGLDDVDESSAGKFLIIAGIGLIFVGLMLELNNRMGDDDVEV